MSDVLLVSFFPEHHQLIVQRLNSHRPCSLPQLLWSDRAHAGNLSGIILYSYHVDKETGLLAPNPGHGSNKSDPRFPPEICESHYDEWRTIAPIYAAIGGKGLGPVLDNVSAETRFIEGAVDRALQFGLSGYNADIEGSASGPREFLPFLRRFAEALLVHNLTLTSDVDGCPQGAEGITCAEYRDSPISGVVLMSWYEAEPHQRLLKKIVNTTRSGSLGATKTMAGWSGSHWMTNCSVMDFVLTQGISSIAWWSGSLRTEANWELLYEFLTVDANHPPAPSARHCGKTTGPKPPRDLAIEITHESQQCVVALDHDGDREAPIALGSCTDLRSKFKFHETGICRDWTGPDASDLRSFAALEEAQIVDESSCKTVICMGAVSCASGAAVEMLRMRCEVATKSFTIDNSTGLLKSEACPGMCAAAAAGTMGLELQPCGTTEARGFHSVNVDPLSQV